MAKKTKLPKGVTTVVAGGKPGTYTEGGKKRVAITQKQYEALGRVQKHRKSKRRSRRNSGRR